MVLRSLTGHFDNTWNSKIALEYIKVVLEKLDIDLYMHVLNNNEVNDIVKSLMKASVPEVDAGTHLALAIVHHMAAE